MGKKSKPKAPKAPDYRAAAQEQGIQNRQTAEHAADLARINQYNPM